VQAGLGLGVQGQAELGLGCQGVLEWIPIALLKIILIPLLPHNCPLY